MKPGKMLEVPILLFSFIILKGTGRPFLAKD